MQILSEHQISYNSIHRPQLANPMDKIECVTAFTQDFVNIREFCDQICDFSVPSAVGTKSNLVVGMILIMPSQRYMSPRRISEWVRDSLNRVSGEIRNVHFGNNGDGKIYSHALLPTRNQQVLEVVAYTSRQNFNTDWPAN